MRQPITAATEAELLPGGVQADREAHPGRSGPLAVLASGGEAHPEEQSERERDDRDDDRLGRLRARSSAAAEAAAVEHGELEGLPREREGTRRPASTASVTAPIWNTTSRIGTARSAIR